jgi:hypothetical protein
MKVFETEDATSFGAALGPDAVLLDGKGVANDAPARFLQRAAVTALSTPPDIPSTAVETAACSR